MFDLTSKVVDFLVISDGNVPSSLIILSEEELVCVDLISDSWPIFIMPYLNPVHASAITCLTHVCDVTPGIFERIAEVGKHDLAGKVSGRDWPITGGTLSDEGQKVESGRDILLTGHEDGSVKLWSCSGVALAPLAIVRTNKFFAGDDLDEPRGESIFREILSL